MSPIKPENKKLYPPRKEWLAIRAEVLAREGNACKTCRIPNYALARWDAENGIWTDYSSLFEVKRGEEAPPGLTRIVLTIAHLDHDPRNCGKPGDRPNLAALCQRHHLAHDQAHHQANARRTRDLQRGQVNLLEGGLTDA